MRYMYILNDMSSNFPYVLNQIEKKEARVYIKTTIEIIYDMTE